MRKLLNLQNCSQDGDNENIESTPSKENLREEEDCVLESCSHRDPEQNQHDDHVHDWNEERDHVEDRLHPSDSECTRILCGLWDCFNNRNQRVPGRSLISKELASKSFEFELERFDERTPDDHCKSEEEHERHYQFPEDGALHFLLLCHAVAGTVEDMVCKRDFWSTLVNTDGSIRETMVVENGVGGQKRHDRADEEEVEVPPGLDQHVYCKELGWNFSFWVRDVEPERD
mmetsp:Transcript_30324/g.53301  ORF Transcript_30324/g.53301 Transcript_30324/m.53301 type:complete len:230 (+) Transcript_30324:620-1309(+)